MAGRLMIYLLTTVLIAELSTSQVLAQSYPGGNAGQQTQVIGPRKQLITIIFSGLGGATLGLSTLSFYSHPQDKLNYIAIGFAFGVIAGTIYTTYQTATNRKNYYGAILPQIEQEQILASQLAVFSEQALSQLQFSWTWDF